MNSIKAKLKEAGKKSAKQITILIIAMTATRNHFAPLAGAQPERFRSIDGAAQQAAEKPPIEGSANFGERAEGTDGWWNRVYFLGAMIYDRRRLEVENEVGKESRDKSINFRSVLALDYKVEASI